MTTTYNEFRVGKQNSTIHSKVCSSIIALKKRAVI